MYYIFILLHTCEIVNFLYAWHFVDYRLLIRLYIKYFLLYNKTIIYFFFFKDLWMHLFTLNNLFYAFIFEWQNMKMHLHVNLFIQFICKIVNTHRLGSHKRDWRNLNYVSCIMHTFHFKRFLCHNYLKDDNGFYFSVYLYLYVSLVCDIL